MNDEFIFNKRLGDVYDCEGYTTSEVLSYFYEKINDFVERFNELEGTTQERLDYLLGEGLSLEVANKINEMYKNGTLQEIINNNLFSDLSTKVNNKIDKIATGYLNIKDYITDDIDIKNINSTFIQSIIDNTNYLRNIKIYIPFDCVINGDILINKVNVEITGGGTIKGTIKIKYDTKTYCFVKLNDITIDNTDNSKNGIELKNAYNVYGFKLNIRYCNNAIQVDDIGERHSGRIILENCIFDHNNYELFSSNITSGYNGYQLVDTQILNCQFYNTLITAIKCKNTDGLIIKNNTFFFSGYQAHDNKKQHNIYLEGGNFTIIEGNNLFEAGYSSIYLNKPTNFIIKGNNIAWCGQRKLSGAIVIEGTSENNLNRLVNSLISSNNIESPSLYGISINSFVQGLIISDNNILFDSSNSKYYGEEEYNLSDRKSINIAEGYKNSAILIANNNYYGSEDNITCGTNKTGIRCRNNMTKNGLQSKGYSIYTLNDSFSTSSLNIDNNNFTVYDTIIFERTSALNIKNIGTGYEGQEILLVNSINSTINLSFPENNKMLINKDTVFKIGTSRKFKYIKGYWYEV